MFSREELQEIYRRLAEPFPETAIERTSGSVTHKGYDTSGIKYQFIVNRINEVLGVGGFRVQREFNVRERPARNGSTLFEVTCDLILQLGQWVDGEFVPFAEATGTGGHSAMTEADAKKGSFTNGFKKVAAFMGAGWQAYAGTLDDDNVPAAEDDDDRRWAHRSSQSTSARNNGAISKAGRGDQVPDRPGANGQNGDNRAPARGRITAGQLGKLRELVTETGSDWSAFRTDVKERHGVNVEYADSKLGSTLITELVSEARRQRSNGHAAEGGAR